MQRILVMCVINCIATASGNTNADSDQVVTRVSNDTDLQHVEPWTPHLLASRRTQNQTQPTTKCPRAYYFIQGLCMKIGAPTSGADFKASYYGHEINNFNFVDAMPRALRLLYKTKIPEAMVVMPTDSWYNKTEYQTHPYAGDGLLCLFVNCECYLLELASLKFFYQPCKRKSLTVIWTEPAE